MVKCRIKSIKPPCDYQVEGIARIWLLDWEDFKGYRFKDNGLYSSCLVTDILRVSEYTELAAPDMVAKYSSSGDYVHKVESFIGGLEASTIANLHLGTKRRQVVVFLSNSGKYFTFGYEAGAVLTYQNQTSEGFGAMVNLSASSKYPLFEVTPDAMKRFISTYRFNPDFQNGAYCETI